MKNVVILKPKAPEVVAFYYATSEDLANLIAFVGKSPTVDIDNGVPVYKFRKHVVAPGSVVFRNEYGDITKVSTIKEVTEMYDTIQEHDFKAEHANKVQTKTKK